MLNGKKIILGITGSIAAYKAVVLLRLMTREGAEVKVVMTPFAKEFVSPLTFATLSGHSVLTNFYNPENGDWNSHVDLGTWADAFVIAPATANTMGKMAHAVADNLLLTTYLSARCPVFIAPAMDLDMYKHPANIKNMAILEEFGNYIIEPGTGELASGLTGKGRFAEPEEIIEYLNNFFSSKKKLSGKKIMVTAGPTVEPVDSVRYISNYSSGKMGYAIAKMLQRQGAEVNLISGPVSHDLKSTKIKVFDVRTAIDMERTCKALYPKMDGAILTAAVSDYRPKTQYSGKIKSGNENLNIELVTNPDIAFELGKMKSEHQFLVGFALETENEKANALNKIKRKNFDFIVLNNMNDEGAGFQTDTNKVTVIHKNNQSKSFELKHKNEVARDIVDELIVFLNSKK